MMLASPLLPSPMFSPTRSSDENTHYRPAKDMETFNSLLPAPVEFVEGSSTGALAVAEGKYEAINSSPKVTKAELHSTAPTKTVASHSRSASANNPQALHSAAIDLTWPASFSRGTGLYNSGNTCFLNSALQCLIHTPPLLRLLLTHTPDTCRVKSGFCMICSMRQTAIRAHGSSKQPFSPSQISNNLQTIAKHLRKGRQEDTHEFLRYAIDGLQKSCLAGYPPKLDTKVQETTWVHKLFGGRLRSRVTCRDCGYNSDTFDRILDLSLDIIKCDSLKEALHKFIAIDYLKGADKYKCEKCKKPVNAEKRFTIHEAPLVLTVHLKRFSPLGRKIGHMLEYPETLSLKPFMSEGQFGPTYSLYGVICHAGSGPNSGHYYAFVKAKDGKWWEMNDEITQQTSLPTDRKSAYMLFYIQNRGQALEASVNQPAKSLAPSQKNSLAAGMKKRQIKDDEDDDKGVKVDAPSPFIGPELPSLASASPFTSPSKEGDPQAVTLKTKIAAVIAKGKGSAALDILGDYASSDEEKDGSDGELPKSKNDAMNVDAKSPAPTTTPWVAPTSSPPPVPSSLSPAPRAALPSSSFYGGMQGRKRKSPESESENQTPHRKPSRPNQAQTSGYRPGNPFNANALTYGKKKHRRMMI